MLAFVIPTIHQICGDVQEVIALLHTAQSSIIVPLLYRLEARQSHVFVGLQSLSNIYTVALNSITAILTISSEPFPTQERFGTLLPTPIGIVDEPLPGTMLLSV